MINDTKELRSVNKFNESSSFIEFVSGSLLRYTDKKESESITEEP